MEQLLELNKQIVVKERKLGSAKARLILLQLNRTIVLSKMKNETELQSSNKLSESKLDRLAHVKPEYKKIVSDLSIETKAVFQLEAELSGLLREYEIRSK